MKVALHTRQVLYAHQLGGPKGKHKEIAKGPTVKSYSPEGDQNSFASQLELINALLAWQRKHPKQIKITISDKRRPESASMGAGAIGIMPGLTPWDE